MIKAFMIASSSCKSKISNAIDHCNKLAGRYCLKTIEYEVYDYIVKLITTTDHSFDQNCCFDEIIIGKCQNKNFSNDSFLKINIDSTGLLIENDYAGTIPVYFSHRHGLVLSNIELCVFIATGSSLNDVSYENLYGFLRYSHFIWDETAWVHIHQLLPDSRYQFAPTGELLINEYIASVRSTDMNVRFTDNKVADELFELNKALVIRSLSDADEIILPLSSGYDSRMIFSVIAHDSMLSNRTRCFTYGARGSIEVEAARRLCLMGGIDWHHIDLPCNFLDKRHLVEISDIFGSSLHMHGMYQLEFIDRVRSQYQLSANAWLTSGFMTGVPAGQHNRLLNINDARCRLTDAMNNFSQSKVWSDADLEKMPIFSGKNYLEKAEERFRCAFDRFDGEIFQKTVMFDVWTRQRNFISYYPRVLEWLCPVASPHMCAAYANFFMSLSERHLSNRKAVELMFLRHYPEFSKIASNSNGIAALGSRFETGMLLLSRALNRLGVYNPLPQRYRNIPLEFDVQAVKHCKEDSFYPLLSDFTELRYFLDLFGGVDMFRDLYNRATQGDVRAYERIVVIQAVALSGLHASCAGVE